MTRRDTLRALAAATLAATGRAVAATPRPRVLDGSGPAAWLAAGGPTGLLALGRDGSLRALQPDGGGATGLGDGLDPASPPATADGWLAARRRDGGLWVRDADGRVGDSTGPALSSGAGLLVLPPSVIGVVDTPDGARLARFDAAPDRRWRIVARSTLAVLPDARPVRARLDGPDGGDQVVVLSGPDAVRYRHGVLGDEIEATELAALRPHDLAVIRALALPVPSVFEDLAPRPVALDGRDRRDGLLTVVSGPSGARLVLVDAAPDPAALRIAAAGDPLGRAHRWLSPITDGRRWLAVHTPHIGGMLHRYRRVADHLTAHRIGPGVSNHRIGLRTLDCSVLHDRWLLIPDARQQRLLLLDVDDDGRLAAEWPIASPVLQSTYLPDRRLAAVLLEDGTVRVVGFPG